MKITDSNVEMQATHTTFQQVERRENLEMWVGNREPSQMSRALGRGDATLLNISTQAQHLQPAKAELTEDQQKAGPADTVEMSIIRAVIERLTGRSLKLFDPAELKAKMDKAAQGEVPPDPKQAAKAPQREGWGMRYDYYESFHEAESTTFAAQGVVKTADGKEIQFNVNMSMSREFMAQQEIHVKAGDALKDPLVINFDGKAAELTRATYNFDLDMNGHDDQIRFVGPGSGFLALDKNQDGKINNGSELFGPTSGNGFAELAKYDQDGNQWIDENDPVYNQLRIWTKNPDGSDHLVALGAKNVGAIYLGHISTPFLLKDEQNNTEAAVRSSGVYLNEDGSAGTVQQLDLVV